MRLGWLARAAFLFGRDFRLGCSCGTPFVTAQEVEGVAVDGIVILSGLAAERDSIGVAEIAVSVDVGEARARVGQTRAEAQCDDTKRAEDQTVRG